MSWQLWVTLGAIALVCLLWLISAGVLLWAVLDPADFQTMLEALGGRWGLLLFLWAVSLVPIYSALQWAMNRYLVGPERLADAIDLRLKQHLTTPVENTGTPQIDRLVHLFNQQLETTQKSAEALEARIAAAVSKTEDERAWLSALLAELNRSVIVCNREGQTLLYNNRARLQFKRLSKASQVAGGGELLGLGRSIYEVIDQTLLDHARDTIERRLARGVRQTSTQCLMHTDTGRTYRIHITPVCRHLFAQTQRIDGMILVIENITEDVKAKQHQQRAIQTLNHQANEQANALEALIHSAPSLETQLKQTLLEQLEFMRSIPAHFGSAHEHALRPFPLEDVSAEDFFESIQQSLHPSNVIDLQPHPALSDTWLKVDGLMLVRAITTLIDEVMAAFSPPSVSIRPMLVDQQLHLSLQWTATEPQRHPDDESWLATSLTRPQFTDGHFGHTIEDVIGYHGGACHWSKTPSANDQHGSWALKVVLPTVEAADALPEALAQRHEGRPEYYDFQFFDVSLRADRQDDTPLEQLSYTVFDTETTGLNPSAGDEIIQVGAIRVVNGRVLSKETFDQLVDPQRPIPANSQAIHGIRPEDVRGQPTIETVLPLFHRFCGQTILVAHNADFDLQCLRLKAPLCGVEFNQPVLDTLLLSAVAHPYQDSHNLDELAQRLGLTIQDRHQALGDAKMTAEVFIRLMPILKDRGIDTLKGALTAQRTVWQKRARY